MVLWVESFQRFCQSHAFWFLLLVYVLFTIFGSLLFMAIEQPQGNQFQAQVLEVRRRFLRENRCVQEGGLDIFLKKVYANGYRNVAILHAGENKWSWDFTSSVFFVVNILATSGYSDSNPLTDGAKLFCVFYSLLGIPLTLFVLSCLSDLLLPVVTRGPVRHLQTHWGLPRRQAALLHVSLLGLVMVMVLLLLPAVILCYLVPGWIFLDALFFCVMTLSTVGEGNYLLGREHSEEAQEGLEFFTTCESRRSGVGGQFDFSPGFFWCPFQTFGNRNESGIDPNTVGPPDKLYTFLPPLVPLL
uniref:Potassium channel, subfamily K, member 7 n=1 Tax=Esox lucius TaxID=8010 RepID=A0A3P8ZZ29_ESOLU